jgi:hypothetical protein
MASELMQAAVAEDQSQAADELRREVACLEVFAGLHVELPPVWNFALHENSVIGERAETLLGDRSSVSGRDHSVIVSAGWTGSGDVEGLGAGSGVEVFAA